MCGENGCGCSICWTGDQCETANNPSAPVFDAESYTIETESISAYLPRSFVVTDDDASLCEGSFCQCGEIRYKLTDSHNGLFKVDEESGGLTMSRVKGEKLADKYELEVVAYNPIEGASKEAKAKVTIQVLDAATSAQVFAHMKEADTEYEGDKPEKVCAIAYMVYLFYPTFNTCYGLLNGRLLGNQFVAQ